jgi:molybdate transport system substrate-binding protein
LAPIAPPLRKVNRRWPVRAGDARNRGFSRAAKDCMKRLAHIALIAVGGLAGLDAGRADEIRVAVATNFATTMDELVAQFEEASEHTVTLSAGSTGAHYAQIKNGAPFELFFAADVERPKLLEDEGVAVAGSRFTYAIGRVALWSLRAGFVDAEGRVLETGSFRHIAIANPDLAPYGAAAREVLERRGLWEALRDRIVQGQDIGQTYSFVYTGSAELGFIAYSQIVRGDDTPIAGSFWLVPDELHAPIEQQAVLLEDAPAARAFLDFVKGVDARAIIRKFGYGP